jgi:TonB family protein
VKYRVFAEDALVNPSLKTTAATPQALSKRDVSKKTHARKLIFLCAAALSLAANALFRTEAKTLDIPTQSTIINSKSDWSPYMADSQRRIKRAWAPPKWDEAKKAVAVATFRLHKNGTITDLRVVTHSSLTNFDEAAIAAITNAAPFRPLPDGPEESFELQFTFDWATFSGGSFNENTRSLKRI